MVVGLGKSGIAAVQAMLKLGADVSVQDSKEAEAVDGQLLTFLEGKGVSCYFHEIPEHVENFDMLILSPGVNPELPFIREAEAGGAEIIGELEIAYRIARGIFIAITGTNGKTTTTTLVGEIFKNAKRKTFVVGNIGVAVISKALESDEDDWLVTETSSFQLQTTRYFKPMVSAILNLTPDHLNRHHTMEAYGQAKAAIFRNQDENGCDGGGTSGISIHSQSNDRKYCESGIYDIQYDHSFDNPCGFVVSGKRSTFCNIWIELHL